MSDAASEQDPVNIGPPEAPFAGLVDDHLARPGCQLGDNIVAPFPSDQQSAHWTPITDAEGVVAMGSGQLAELFGRWKIYEVRLVTLASVYYMSANRAEDVEELLDRRNNASSLGKDLVIAALYGAETPWINKVPLYVDNDQRRCGKGELECVGASVGKR